MNESKEGCNINTALTVFCIIVYEKPVKLFQAVW